jgi:hydrogenase maturation protease
MTAARHALVLGIGNILLQDEGVGVVVADRIAAAQAAGDPAVPAGTRIVDGGTLGLDLLPMIGDADQVVIVDAVNLGRPPGTVTVLHDGAVQAALSGHVSPHQIGVGDLVAAARLTGTMPPRLALIGIQPAVIAIGLELTEPVAAAVDIAAGLVLRELAERAIDGDLELVAAAAGGAGDAAGSEPGDAGESSGRELTTIGA